MDKQTVQLLEIKTKNSNQSVVKKVQLHILIIA